MPAACLNLSNPARSPFPPASSAHARPSSQLPPLLGERARVWASVSSNLILGVVLSSNATPKGAKIQVILAHWLRVGVRSQHYTIRIDMAGEAWWPTTP